MLNTVKNKSQRLELIALLTFIVDATKSAGSGFAPKADLDKLAKAEPTFLVLDPNVKDEEGNIKATATQLAIDALAAGASAAASGSKTEATAKPEPMSFETVYLDELPPINKGGNKGGDYKFETLEAPQPDPARPGKFKYAAFFVPVTEARPNPAKTLASTVASANKRHANTDKAIFTVRKHVVDGVLKGAYVIRQS